MHATSPLQAGCPKRPHAPPWQPPLAHSPLPFEHTAPGAAHRLVLLSQQPPPAQALPLQQGWPGPPHALQVLLAPQLNPEAVQKSA